MEKEINQLVSHAKSAQLPGPLASDHEPRFSALQRLVLSLIFGGLAAKDQVTLRSKGPEVGADDSCQLAIDIEGG